MLRSSEGRCCCGNAYHYQGWLNTSRDIWQAYISNSLSENLELCSFKAHPTLDEANGRCRHDERPLSLAGIFIYRVTTVSPAVSGYHSASTINFTPAACINRWTTVLATIEYILEEAAFKLP